MFSIWRALNMKIKSLLYLAAALAGVLALIAGFGRLEILFITDTKTAVIVAASAGFIMCASGMISHFVTKAPSHPLTITGYIVGAVALFTGIVQIFNMDIPPLSDPFTALIIVTAAIAIKICIARLAFLIKEKEAVRDTVIEPTAE
jgi:hypothetical protein